MRRKARATKRRAKKRAAVRGLTRKQAAALLGCNVRTIAKFEDDGMPVLRRGRGGRPNIYDGPALEAWKARRDQEQVKTGVADVAVERARRERAQAVLTEQTFQMRQRELLPRAEVERAWSAHVAAVRTKLMALPTALADQLARAATSDGVSGVETALDAAVRDVLRELAEGDGATVESEARTA